MARVKGGTIARTRRKKVLKAAKGYFGSKHRLYKTAKEQLLHSGTYAYRDRKRKKRDFRKLWITRINAACRENNISYSKFMNGITKAKLSVNRKMLAEIAVSNPETFKDLVEISKNALEGKTYTPKKIETKKETIEEKSIDKKEIKESKVEKEKELENKEKPKVTVKKEEKKKESIKKTEKKEVKKIEPVKNKEPKTTTVKKTSTQKKVEK